jgi:hypothetical protein
MTRHPANAEAWEWDEGNEGELAAHNITPWEVYEVWANHPQWSPNVRYRVGDWKMYGKTDGGRRLAIVLSFYADRGLLRPITGWDATPGERSRFFKGV